MSVTIREMAKVLDLAPSTVSQALNNKGSLSINTRERVRRVARQMGYYAMNDPFGIDPTLSGRPIRLVITGASSGHMNHRSLSGFPKGAIDGIKSALKPYKVHPIIIAEDDVGRDYPPNLVATLVLGGYMKDSNVKHVACSKLPVVVVGSLAASNNMCSVAPDAVATIRKAVAHLAELGHEHIAFLNGPSTTLTSDHKLTGFVRAMYDMGKRADRVYGSDTPLTTSETVQLVKKMLRGPWKNVTAIVCAYESTARAVILAITDMGFRVPHDMSVVAYDAAGTRNRDFPLTSFGVSAHTLGRYAVSVALSVRANKELVGSSLIVNPELIRVGSTAKVKEIS